MALRVRPIAQRETEKTAGRINARPFRVDKSRLVRRLGKLGGDDGAALSKALVDVFRL